MESERQTLGGKRKANAACGSSDGSKVGDSWNLEDMRLTKRRKLNHTTSSNTTTSGKTTSSGGTTSSVKPRARDTSRGAASSVESETETLSGKGKADEASLRETRRRLSRLSVVKDSGARKRQSQLRRSGTAPQSRQPRAPRPQNGRSSTVATPTANLDAARARFREKERKDISNRLKIVTVRLNQRVQALWLEWQEAETMPQCMTMVIEFAEEEAYLKACDEYGEAIAQRKTKAEWWRRRRAAELADTLYPTIVAKTVSTARVMSSFMYTDLQRCFKRMVQWDLLQTALQSRYIGDKGMSRVFESQAFGLTEARLYRVLSALVPQDEWEQHTCLEDWLETCRIESADARSVFEALYDNLMEKGVSTKEKRTHDMRLRGVRGEARNLKQEAVGDTDNAEEVGASAMENREVSSIKREREEEEEEEEEEDDQADDDDGDEEENEEEEEEEEELQLQIDEGLAFDLSRFAFKTDGDDVDMIDSMSTTVPLTQTSDEVADDVNSGGDAAMPATYQAWMQFQAKFN